MTETTRSERTARILGLRLEELARALERSGAPPAEIARLLEAASVATANAVALELLSAERARGIWSETAARHPQVAGLREEPRLAA
jgi:soluble lytic murein transglycosylase-like protein